MNRLNLAEFRLTKLVKCGHPLPKIKRMSSLKISIKRDYDNFQNSWLQNYIQSSQLSIHNGPKTFMKSYLQLYTLQLFHSIFSKKIQFIQYWTNRKGHVQFSMVIPLYVFYVLTLIFDKIQVFLEGHKSSYLVLTLPSSVKCNWKITPNFCGLLRKPEF